MIFSSKFTPNPRISYSIPSKYTLLPGIILLLFFLLPLQAQDVKSEKPFQFVGHRGASYLAPENSLASINLAWEIGADAAECDVWLTSDNRVVVIHDKNTKNLTGKNYDIPDTPWEVLQHLTIKLHKTNLPEYEGETIPLLKDLLTTIPSDRMLVIEIKAGIEILPYLESVIKKHWKSGKIAIIAFDFETIAASKALFPKVPCYYLSSVRADVKKQFDHAVKANLDGLDLHHSIIDKKLADQCNQAGLDLWCWTVNDLKTALKMKELGVSAVTTNRPEWLRKQIFPVTR